MLERPDTNTRDKASHLAGVPVEAPAPPHHPAKAHGFQSLMLLLPVPKGFPSPDV